MAHKEVMEFKVAGYSERERLRVWPTPFSQCGNIKDGILLAHDDDGPWVLSFGDLERIYLRAKELSTVP